jgi:histidine triad (HIT) family protein
MSCVFCVIAQKEIPSSIVYENEDVICFNDLKPITPVHVLIVPKKHFDDILDLSATEEGQKVMSAVLRAIPEVVRITGVESGFRLINNCREDGGQTVMHVHFHLIGGIKLGAKML